MSQTFLPPALALLEPILLDDKVTEIMIDAPDRVLVERRGQLEDTGVNFGSFEALRAAIDACLAMGGAAFKAGQTVCDTRLADGTRILAILPPTAVNSPCLVMRKFYQSKMTMAQVLEHRALSPEALAVLQQAIKARKNLLVAGGTGSGKTTVLNLLTEEIPAEERVVVVEANLELSVRHPRVVRLSADLSPDQSYLDLIHTAAKMRPDRLIFSELRAGETLKILDLINVGYDGSMMTLHATSPEDVLARVEAMCLMANAGLGLGEIRHIIASAIHVITNQARLPNGQRRFTQITELRGLEDDRYILQPLFRYNEDNDTLEATGAKPSF